MERKIYRKILGWKEEMNGRTALLIDGARRVGKSYIVKKFVENEYKSAIILDFNNISKEIKRLFEEELTDLNTFFRHLSVFTGIELYERQSAIVFDEVQLYPKARGAIKYLVEDGRYDYIETGSLISIKKNVKDIVIPSEEEHMEMFPMDFEEFLMAKGETTLYSYMRVCFEKGKEMGHIHRKAMSLFREYMIVGGMPQAVAAYINGDSFRLIDRIKRNILSLYKADISKYADGQETKVSAIFEEIPAQLNRHEKKFRMSDISQTARRRDYDSAFFWLADAMIINVAYNTTEPNIGLRMNMDRTTLKCYMGDTGLLLTLANQELEEEENELYRKIISGKLEVNQGMITENIVSQMIRATGRPLYFFSSYSKEEKEDNMEIDFLIRERKVKSRHNIRPIEVKSTTRFSIVSLQKFRNKYANYITSPVVLYPGDYKKKNDIIFLPLYMAPFL